MALRSANVDLVHVLSVPDAVAALASRRSTGAPVVFGTAEVLTRGRLADRRLRLRLLTTATKDADALVATTAAAQEAHRRWLAVDARLISPGDGAANLGLYRSLLTQT
jgi:hypothetical protein